MVCILASTLSLSAFHASQADSHPRIVDRADAGSNGAVEIVYRDASKKVPTEDDLDFKTVRVEKNQVDTYSIKVADDRRTVGWTAEFKDCCTAYPIPLVLVIYKNDQVLQRFKPGQMIYGWNFLDNGGQVAFCSGTVKGDSGINCELHDSETGRLLATYLGGANVPKWMQVFDDYSDVTNSFLVEHAYSGSDGTAHIIYRGVDTAIPKDRDQVDTEFIKVAADMKTVGWAVRVENCCTSYPIPMAIVTYKNGKVQHRINASLMISEWNFVAGGRQVAFCVTTVHGDYPTECYLHDSKTGRLLASYNEGQRVPKWMKALD